MELVIVYMSRKERRAVQHMLQGEGSPIGGSMATLHLLLEQVSEALNRAAGELPCCGDDAVTEGTASCHAYDEVTYMEDLVDDLLDEWQSPKEQLRSAYRRWQLVAVHRRWQLVAAYRRWQGRAVPYEPMSHDTAQQVIQVATELVTTGQAAKVKVALAMVGCQRVSEVSEADVPAFMAALAP